jgi:hypothetical protein
MLSLVNIRIEYVNTVDVTEIEMSVDDDVYTVGH